MPNKDREREYKNDWYQAHKEERKAQMKSYYQAHKEERKAQMKSYYQAHREERKAQMKSYYQAHKEERKACVKAWGQAHREERKAQMKSYYQAHKEERKEYKNAWYQAHREEQKAYKKSDTNSLGHTKESIRVRSRYFLFNVLKHTKLEGYEIHHCFGYDDYRNFIYIPKALHLQIHQYLRDNNIDADTDHYSKIAHLVVGWDGYVYIKA